MVEFSSLHPEIGGTPFPGTYPVVGINSHWLPLGGWFEAFAGLVMFDVSSLSGKTIESATLSVTANSAPVGPSRMDWAVGTVATPWSPWTVSWLSMASMLFYAPTWQSFPYPTQSGQSYTADVVATVRNWADGTYPNYGIVFQSTDYTPPGNVDSLGAYGFLPPTLTVIYH
jgi:hypothetical protein